MTPDDEQITSTINRVVAQFYKDDRDNLTVKRVRKAIEDELGLRENWLKDHEKWAARSKDFITSEVQRLEETADGSDDEAPVSKSRKETNGTATKSRKRKSPDETKKAVTAKAKPKPKPQKRRKLSSDDEEEAPVGEATSLSSVDDTPSPVTKRPATAARRGQQARPKKIVESEDEDDEGEAQIVGGSLQETRMEGLEGADKELETISKPAGPSAQDDGHDSESSLSSVLDEPPKRKKRQKKSPAPKSGKSKTTAKAKPAAKKESKDLTPDEEEIRRLQGWLVKCGIRKVWGKELKPFETPKAKIAHLKSMLADAGMTGRYSIEKASRIKEQRELAADLEAVTAFDDQWGNKEDGRSKRRGGMAESLGLDPSLIDDGSDDED